MGKLKIFDNTNTNTLLYRVFLLPLEILSLLGVSYHRKEVKTWRAG